MRKAMVGRFFQPGSSKEYYRRRVPSDLVKVLFGKKILVPVPEIPGDKEFIAICVFDTHIKTTTGTSNPEYAEYRRGAIDHFLSGYYISIRNGPANISQKQLVALGGKIYKRMIELNEDNPGSVDDWAVVKGISRAVREGRYTAPEEFSLLNGREKDNEMAKAIFGDDLTAGINSLPATDEKAVGLEKRYGLMTNLLLRENGIHINEASRNQLLSIVDDAVKTAAIQLKNNAGGDYSPDPSANKYPEFKKKREAYTLDMLFDKWKIDGNGKRKKSRENVRKMVETFKEAHGAVDIQNISKRMVVEWRDGLQPKGELNNKSINQYVTMMGALINVAIRDDLFVGVNPFKGMGYTLSGGKRPTMNRYDDDEVTEILRIARLQTDPARRWLPWLAVCTGARIGELTQMYKANVTTWKKTVPYIHILPDPDGGGGKNELMPRMIPVHPILIEEGFLKFVETLDDGPVFYKVGRKTENNTAGELVTMSMSHWIRKQGFKDPKKAPNHAFRLWWRTTAAVSGLEPDVKRYLFGHEQGLVESGYVDLHPDQTAPEIAKLKIPVPDIKARSEA